MSDKPKTIQEALAEVQRKINEAEKMKSTTDWTDASSYGGKPSEPEMPKTTAKPAAPKPSVATKAVEKPGVLSTIGKTIVKNPKTAIAGAAIAAGTAALGSDGIQKVKQFGKDVWNQATTGEGPTPIKDIVTGKTAASSPTAVADNTPTTSTTAVKAEPPKTETPKPAEPAKVETPKPAKMSFADAYAKARSIAKAAGKDENLAQFKFDRGGGEKVYQAAATKADYVPMKQQFAVDINAPSKSKGEQGPPMPNIGSPMPKETETTPKTESGGKKKMSEETNPLIDMFLKLQEKNTLTPNIFEAAKKAKKDHDRDGKIESEKDEVWGSRFRAAKLAGKMQEAEVDYSAPDRPAVTKDNKPSTPAQTNAATSGPSDADKKALDSKIKTIAKEEVSFSEAELAFFASVFEAVAPNRPEPTKGVNPTVRDTELTDETIAEGRPRKNPTPETTERDARQHIQVQAGRASGGTVVDFKHDNGKISKLTPGMGRAITAHLNGLKPAERQEAVKKMHASPEGLKV